MCVCVCLQNVEILGWVENYTMSIYSSVPESSPVHKQINPQCVKIYWHRYMRMYVYVTLPHYSGCMVDGLGTSVAY